MLQSKSFGLFLGTGFSRAIFNIPTAKPLIKEFLEDSYIERLIKPFKEEINGAQQLENLVRQYQRLANVSLLEEDKIFYKEKLITLLTAYSVFLHEHYYKKPDYYLHEAKVLLRNYCQYLFSDKQLSDMELINFLKEHVFFITTNIDMSVETVLKDLFLECDQSIDFHYPGFEKGKPVESSIPIFKLNGSSNWFVSEDNGQMIFEKDLWTDEHTVIVKNRDRTRINYKQNQFYPVFMMCHDFNKSTTCFDSALCQRIWESAKMMFTQAEKMEFMGSGMPPANYKIFAFIYDLAKSQKERQMRIKNVVVSDYLEALIKHACDLSGQQLDLNIFLKNPDKLLDVASYKHSYQLDQGMKLF